MSSLTRLPPLNALRTFVVAARHLNFSRAAEELHVSAAAVSQQIKQLEDHIGRPLFHRDGRSLRLTEAGLACLPRLTEAFDGILEALSTLNAGSRSGALTVSVAPSFAAKWLVPRLETFRSAYPDIDVRVSASMDLVDLGASDIDCAIRYGAGRYPGLLVERMLREAVFPVCSPDLLDGEHPLVRPQALRHHVLLHDDSPDRDASCPDWRMWLRAAKLTDVDPMLGPRFNQSNLVIDAALAGHGVALAKAQLARTDLERGRLIRPFGAAQPLEFAYYLICHPDKAASPKVRAFRTWIMEEAAGPNRFTGELV